jgi:hypothetical protein
VGPNTDHHDGLRRKAKLEDLSDVYEIVPVGAEDLGSKWIQEGEADTVIMVHAMPTLKTSSEAEQVSPPTRDCYFIQFSSISV